MASCKAKTKTVTISKLNAQSELGISQVISEICQDMVAACEKGSNCSLTREKAAWEAPRAGKGWGSGGNKNGIPFSTPGALRQSVTRHPFIKKAS